METNVLSIDIGSSSVRATLYDRFGRQVPGIAARLAWEMRVGPDGKVEGEAGELLGRVYRCIDTALDQARDRAAPVAGVAVSTFVSNVLAVDPEGRAISPIFPYSDTRPAQEAVELRRRLDEAAVHQRTGCRFHPSYLPARLLWVQRTRPELLEPGVRWMTVGEYLALQLFGRTAASFSAASWSGLLDRQRLDWDTELLAALPLKRGALSLLVDIDIPFEGLQPPFAERWPLLQEIPWFPALGDGAAANVGSGCLDASRACLTIGTSSAIRVTLPDPVRQVPPGLWCYRIDRRRSLVGGALNEGGNVHAWLNRTLRLQAGKEVEAALAARPPDSHGLTFLPLLVGERSPGWDADRRGTLHGLSLATTPLDILQAGLEGVAYRLAQVYQQLRPELPAEPEIVAAGGALFGSPAWSQILADVLGKSVQVGTGEQATARGAARLALEALVPGGDWEPGDWSGEAGERIFEPDPERHTVYAQAVERQQDLYERLTGTSQTRYEEQVQPWRSQREDGVGR
jgi:gluconokinase